VVWEDAVSDWLVVVERRSVVVVQGSHTGTVNEVEFSVIFVLIGRF